MVGWVIKTEKLGKQYSRPTWPLARRSTNASPWALRDISVEIGAGETVGIIGRNGGGKSTFLKLLSGVMLPTEGSAHVRGRLDAMLELGTAFDPDLSGRDNVELYVSLLGLRGTQARIHLDEIIDFSELNEQINMPMSSYSTGMFVRLAFAAQTSLAPQVLIVDEALSVGDHFFQQKAAARIDGLVQKGTTLLFVSHDVGLIRRLCNRAVYLKQGRLICDDSAERAILAYMQERSDVDRSPSPPRIADQEHVRTAPYDHPSAFEQSLWRSLDVRNSYGKILAVATTTLGGTPTTTVRMGEILVLHILFTMPSSPEAQVLFRINDKLGQWVVSTGSAYVGLGAPAAQPGSHVHFVAEIQASLEAGTYDFAVLIGTMQNNSVIETIDFVTGVGPVEVYFDYENDLAPFVGRFGPNVRARYHHQLPQPAAQTIVGSAQAIA